MVPCADCKEHSADTLLTAPRAHHGCDLDRLIDISTTTQKPLVIQDDAGQDVSVIDKTTLLKDLCTIADSLTLPNFVSFRRSHWGFYGYFQLRERASNW